MSVLDEWGFTLERYALHSVENCPDRPVRLAFDSGIQLTAPEITIQDGGCASTPTSAVLTKRSSFHLLPRRTHVD